MRAREEHQKYTYLRTLLGLLSERGWSRDDKRDLLLFLERIVNLRDGELEKQYVAYRSQLNREGKIMYIPLGERELAREIELRGISVGMAKGKAEGKAEGRAEGKEEMARSLLVRGDYSPEVISEIAGLPLEKIHSLMN